MSRGIALFLRSSEGCRVKDSFIRKKSQELHRPFLASPRSDLASC